MADLIGRKVLVERPGIKLPNDDTPRPPIVGTVEMRICRDVYFVQTRKGLVIKPACLMFERPEKGE